MHVLKYKYLPLALVSAFLSRVTLGVPFTELEPVIGARGALPSLTKTPARPATAFKPPSVNPSSTVSTTTKPQQVPAVLQSAAIPDRAQKDTTSIGKQPFSTSKIFDPTTAQGSKTSTFSSPELNQKQSSSFTSSNLSGATSKFRSYADAVKSPPQDPAAAKIQTSGQTNKHCKRAGICDGAGDGPFAEAKDVNGVPNKQKFEQWYSKEAGPSEYNPEQHQLYLELQRMRLRNDHDARQKNYKNLDHDAQKQATKPQLPGNIATMWRNENGKGVYRTATSGLQSDGNPDKGHAKDPNTNYAASIHGQEAAFLHPPPPTEGPHAEHSIYYNTAAETGDTQFQDGHILNKDVKSGHERPACLSNCRGNTAIHNIKDEYYGITGDPGAVSEEQRQGFEDKHKKQLAEQGHTQRRWLQQDDMADLIELLGRRWSLEDEGMFAINTRSLFGSLLAEISVVS